MRWNRRGWGQAKERGCGVSLTFLLLGSGLWRIVHQESVERHVFWKQEVPDVVSPKAKRVHGDGVAILHRHLDRLEVRVHAHVDSWEIRDPGRGVG